MGVGVGVAVSVLVEVGVRVAVGVNVLVGFEVADAVTVLVLVSVGVVVAVGVDVLVIVEVGAGIEDAVGDGVERRLVGIVIVTPGGGCVVLAVEFVRDSIDNTTVIEMTTIASPEKQTAAISTFEYGPCMMRTSGQSWQLRQRA